VIGSINSSSAPQTDRGVVSKATALVIEPPAAQSNQSASDKQASSTQNISTLAQQLSASASRAEERDRSLTRSELADRAKSILNQIEGDAYFVNKAKHDGEVPSTSDPVLLARAKQATEFVNSAAKGSASEKNPFAGLSREQLANIVYDESGPYTVNERRAAFYEAYSQEQAWREKVCAQAIDQYNRTGKLTKFFNSVLEHFKELPAIEQAQYPKDYASDLQFKIDLDFNYRTHTPEGKAKDLMSLTEVLFKQSPQRGESLHGGVAEHRGCVMKA